VHTGELMTSRTGIWIQNGWKVFTGTSITLHRNFSQDSESENDIRYRKPLRVVHECLTMVERRASLPEVTYLSYINETAK